MREKHSFADVDSYVRSEEGAKVLAQAGVAGMQPSVFVDKLERAGMVAFFHGWQTTEAGRAILNAA